MDEVSVSYDYTGDYSLELLVSKDVPIIKTT